MKCSNCGAANPADAKFCGECGHHIAVAQQAASGAPPPQEEKSGGSPWDDIFKWIGIGVVGLFVLGLLASM